MATCKKIKRTSTRVCIGSLNRKVRILARAITPPSGSSAAGANVDFGENFTDFVPREIWGMLNTLDGKTIFDETNQTRKVVTHEAFIRFIPNVTFEEWLDIQRIGSSTIDTYNILKVENYEEANKFYRFACSIRGVSTKEVNWS